MERLVEKPHFSERLIAAVLSGGAGLLADVALFVGIFDNGLIGLACAVPALLLAALCWHGSPRTRALQLGAMAAALALLAVGLAWFVLTFTPRFM